MTIPLTRGAKTNADITALLRARHSLLWVVTREEVRVERAIVEAAGAATYNTRFWDCAAGITGPTGTEVEKIADPVGALDYMKNQKTRCVYVMRDLHKWLDPIVLRTLRNLARDLQGAPKEVARTIVVLTPSSEIPPELAGHATLIDYPLPDRAEIASILDDVLASLPENIREAAAPNGTRDAAIDAAVGLTAEEAGNCYARSLVSVRRVDPAIVGGEKKRVIAREKVLTWHDPDPRGLEAIGGLDLLKGWLRARRAAFTPRARAFGLPAPKGAMLVGVPGCLHPNTPIADPMSGTIATVEERWAAGDPFHVWALGPCGPTISTAMPPQRYDEAPMFVVALEDGRSITVTGAHRVLSQDGWIAVGDLSSRLESGPVLLVTTPESDLAVPPQDVARCPRTAQGSLGGYPTGPRSDDERPHLGEGGGRVPSPSPDGALAHNRQRSCVGGSASAQAHSQPCRSSDPQPTLGFEPPPFAPSRTDRLVAVLRGPEGHQQPYSGTSATASRPASGSALHDTGNELLHDVLGSMAGASIRSTRVRSVTQAVPAVYYDFHVPGFENYWAAGMWHHNCGKSLTAKCIASAWGMPLLRLDLGALKSKYVGESEGNIRKALSVAEAVAPCVLWLDEIEKALGGATGPQGDGGVSADALGAVLSWMQERQGSVFVIATANDVRSLPPELLRKGRFDEVFWVDLPTGPERAGILASALTAHGRTPSSIDLEQLARATVTFTGAEIANLVPDALFAAFEDGERALTTEDLLKAAKTVVPLAKTASERIEGLRAWANGRARPASLPEAEQKTAGRDLDL